MNIRKAKGWLGSEGLILIEGWAREGFSEDEIAAKCGVTPEVFRKWKSRNPELQAALCFGREATDFLAERALYKRVLGYDYTEETWELKPNKETGTSELQLTKKQQKHQQPDVSAISLWLKKRKRQTWGDGDTTDETSSAATGIGLLPKVLTDNDNDTGGGDT